MPRKFAFHTVCLCSLVLRTRQALRLIGQVWQEESSATRWASKSSGYASASDKSRLALGIPPPKRTPTIYGCGLPHQLPPITIAAAKNNRGGGVFRLTGVDVYLPASHDSDKSQRAREQFHISSLVTTPTADKQEPAL